MTELSKDHRLRSAELALAPHLSPWRMERRGDYYALMCGDDGPYGSATSPDGSRFTLESIARAETQRADRLVSLWC